MGVITSQKLYGPAKAATGVPASAVPEPPKIEPAPEVDVKPGSYLGIVRDRLSEFYYGFVPGSPFHKMAQEALTALDAHVKSRNK